jgi:hypothetical protein
VTPAFMFCFKRKHNLPTQNERQAVRLITMTMEPRSSPVTRRRESSTRAVDGISSQDLIERLLEHEEPDFPIHPGLEFEVLEGAERNLLEEEASAKHDPKKDVKLLLSFVFLVISGSANVVLCKLQAIPM